MSGSKQRRDGRTAPDAIVRISTTPDTHPKSVVLSVEKPQLLMIIAFWFVKEFGTLSSAEKRAKSQVLGSRRASMNCSFFQLQTQKHVSVDHLEDMQHGLYSRLVLNACSVGSDPFDGDDLLPLVQKPSSHRRGGEEQKEPDTHDLKETCKREARLALSSLDRRRHQVTNEGNAASDQHENPPGRERRVCVKHGLKKRSPSHKLSSTFTSGAHETYE